MTNSRLETSDPSRSICVTGGSSVLKLISMNRFIECHRTAIANLCLQYGVKELYLFGSALRKDFTATSDVDFLVEFDWSDEKNLSGRFFGLKSELEELLGRSVDLVCYSAIRNPYFKSEVDETKRPIYAA